MTVSISGFITTPNTCGVMSLLNTSGAFLTTVITDAETMKNSLTAAASALTSLPGIVTGIVLNDVQALADQLLSIASGAVSTLISHLTAHFTDLVNNLTMAVTQASAQAGLLDSGCTLPSAPPATQSSPCGNINQLFGSIMGLGSALIGSVMGAISKVTDTVNNLISGTLSDIASGLNMITAGVNDIAGFAVQMTNMVANEVAAKAAMLADMISFNTANALFSLIGHPCAQQVLHVVGTPELLSHLG